MKPEQPVRTVILAAVEPSAASDEVTRIATEMSRIVPGAELHIVYVIDLGPPPQAMALSLTDLIAEGRAFVDRVIAAAGPATSCRVAGHLVVGPPADRILQLAADIAADLVVVGTHEKRGLARLLGSVSQRVVRNAACPVLVARVKRDEDTTAPKIEPPCPDCVAMQRATNGETLWCARHASRRVHAHLHYERPSSFGGGSMFIRPEP